MCVESFALAGGEKHVLQVQVGVVSTGMRQRSQQFCDRVEHHHPMIVIRNSCESDGEIMSIRDLPGRYI